jgi:simple sugar transport system ATP-binding protein
MSTGPTRDASAPRPVIEARKSSKSYGAVQALIDVDLAVFAGEVVGLVGDNGAGKTTCVKCLSGVLRPDSGCVAVDGHEQRDLTAEHARILGIETVYQNLSLIDTLDITQNFFLNRELVYNNLAGRKLRWMNRRRMYRDAKSKLHELGLTVDVRRPVSALSGGQRQMIAVGRAISWGRHIVILDEPAAALGIRQSAQVLNFIRAMASRGVAVLFISHNLQHVFQVTDRLVVFRHGHKVGDMATKDTTGQEVVSLITGSDTFVAEQGVAF